MSIKNIIIAGFLVGGLLSIAFLAPQKTIVNVVPPTTLPIKQQEQGIPDLSQLLNQFDDNGSRVIEINGEINAETGIIVGDKIRRLDKISHETIEIDITSPGGVVYAGLQVIDAMHAAKSPIKTVCRGYAMSMASFILAAGTKGMRYAEPHSTILIHQVSSQEEGTLEHMKNELKETQRLEDTVLSIMHDATGLSVERLLKEISFDHYMPPSEAKSLGLIDHIQ